MIDFYKLRIKSVIPNDRFSIQCLVLRVYTQKFPVIVIVSWGGEAKHSWFVLCYSVAHLLQRALLLPLRGWS